MSAESVDQAAEGQPKSYGNYRRKPITAVTGRFTSLGDGLSKSMEIEGEAHEPGTWVTHVVRSKVGPHKMILGEDGKAYTLDETYVGGTVALIDDDLVAEALNTMEKRIKEREDAAVGKLTLLGVDDAAAAPGAGKPKAGDDDDEGGKGIKAKAPAHSADPDFHDETKDPADSL